MNADFLFIADPAILAIPVIESHEPLIDIKLRSELLYGPPPECELTASDYTKLRKTVFEKLCLAQKRLPKSWRLRLYEGFRSLVVQDKLFKEEYARVCTHCPEKSAKEIFEETTRLVSPVVNIDGSKNIPPHNTGGAVDVELVDGAGDLVDMGMTAKDWLQVPSSRCETNCSEISPEAQKNRQILRACMEAEGFVNYPTEWWHFSYGDRYWAYYKKKPHAIYGAWETS